MRIVDSIFQADAIAAQFLCRIEFLEVSPAYVPKDFERMKDTPEHSPRARKLYKNGSVLVLHLLPR